MKKGDPNTKYFHGCKNKRRRENEILNLEHNGRILFEVDGIKNAIVEHFQNQFAARGVIPLPCNFNFKRFSNLENEELVKKFSKEEIRRAVWEFERSKSPGPDGVNFRFTNEFGEDIKNNFFCFLTDFHSNDRIVRGANYSFLVLVPKKKNPTKVLEFRPISLIECIYKVISKVFVKTLKKVIGFVVSESQLAFISSK